VLAREVKEELAVAHDEDVAPRGGDVLEGVAVEGNDVGVVAGRERAEGIAEAGRFSSKRGRRDHGGPRVLPPSLHAIDKLFGVAAVRSSDGIGAEDHLQARGANGVAK